MFIFRVLEGMRVAREFRRPAAVNRFIKSHGDLFQFTIQAGYMNEDTFVVTSQFTSKQWMDEDIALKYRRRMRLMTQAKHDKKRRP